jgi:hypothetical protein
MNDLSQALEKIGKRTEAFETPDGSRLLLLPYGARILGLYPPDSNENFYWVNRDLLNAESAQSVFDSDGWQNTGGDRTWLTPELDIFFPDYPECQEHWEPPQLDASEYSVEGEDSGICMSKELSLHLARPDCDVKLNVSKILSGAANPLRYEKEMQEVMDEVVYAGYSQTTVLTLKDGRDEASIGIWNLIQLPHGGDLLVPTYSKTAPLVLFGDIPDEFLICDQNLVRFRVCFPGEHKIGIRAVETTGRVGYLYQQGDEWSLVVRNFFVNPSGKYLDVPKNDPDDLGYSVNAVNVDSALGDFCELEYHVPAAGRAGVAVVSDHCVDVSQVWAFRGNEGSIRAVARKLLGSD